MCSESAAMSSSTTSTHPHPTRKRSKTSRAHHQSEEEYLALSLLMLARGDTNPSCYDEQQQQHRCSVCGKGFDSYQALGGHKASHRNSSNKPSEDKRRNDETAPVAAESSSGRGHRCSICSRTFPTGQALGGHKRRHYEGVIKGSNKGGKSGSSGESRSEVTMTSATSANDRGFEIDLNMPPPPVMVSEFGFGGQCFGADDEEVLSPLPAKKPRFNFIHA